MYTSFIVFVGLGNAEIYGPNVKHSYVTGDDPTMKNAAIAFHSAPTIYKMRDFFNKICASYPALGSYVD